jgi:hypothetical protein
VKHFTDYTGQCNGITPAIQPFDTWERQYYFADVAVICFRGAALAIVFPSLKLLL